VNSTGASWPVSEYRYRVAAGAAEAELRDRGSRFVARVAPVVDETAASAALADFRAIQAGATHYCWTRRLGSPAVERWSDAGEPRGTAGMPMLLALRGAELTDVLALVARWFGGVKLGKGGLARAYGGVVRQALAGLEVAERLVYDAIELEVPYEQLGAVRRLVQPPRVVLVDPHYGQRVRCTLRVVPPARAVLLDELAAIGLTPRARS
jgi:uncharacterized YigZ family protein